MIGFVGYATSWATRAKLPIHLAQEDGGGFLEWAYEPMQDYLTGRKEATFANVMRDKAVKLGLPVEE